MMRFLLAQGCIVVLISANFPMCALFKSAKPKPFVAEALPASLPELKDAQLAASSYGQPVGGDLHDFIRVSSSRVLFALFDVAGRRDQNRAIISAAQTTFRSSGQQLLSNDDANEADAMIEVCVQMNRGILKASPRVYPCPVFAGCYNETLGTICYVNAGHTPALLRDRSGITELGATGLPLGLFSHSAADASIVALEPGAALLLVSRGLVEANCKGKEFGLAWAKKMFLAGREQTGEEICASMLSQVQQFLDAKAAGNDVTILALTRSAAAKAFAAATI
jgi:sigma-B regulation protein RsbU (phosphoserine phosphatase)